MFSDSDEMSEFEELQENNVSDDSAAESMVSVKTTSIMNQINDHCRCCIYNVLFQKEDGSDEDHGTPSDEEKASSSEEGESESGDESISGHSDGDVEMKE